MKIGPHHRKALRRLRDEELRMIELDGFAPTSPDIAKEQLGVHLDAVRAVQGIDIMLGDSRDYEALRYCASAALGYIPEDDAKPILMREGILDKVDVVEL